MPGYQQIETSRPNAFGIAGQDLLRLADQAGGIETTFTKTVDQVTSGTWKGDSRDAAAGAAERTVQPLRELTGELTTASRPLADVGRTGEQGRAQLVSISGEATTAGFVVTPSGMVVL